jgi:predicted short-subunit dehydrogenase-like oxidoreductase (DUF2520 family)
VQRHRILAIVGAGRVGQSLARRLRQLGWEIGAVTTQSSATARTAVRKIGGGVPHGTLTRHILGADLVLITTPDSALRGTAAALARLGGEEWRNKVVLHTSGANDRRVLRSLERLGACTGSLHPLQTFSGKDAPDLDGVVFAVEGQPEARRVAREVARSLGGIPVTISGRNKVAYHAAGTLVAGSALGLVEAATRILMRIGFHRKHAVRSLLPLMRQMLLNFERFGPKSAWTGPLSRGDAETVTRHIAALHSISPRHSSAYAALNSLTLELLAPAKSKSIKHSAPKKNPRPKGL